MTADEMGVLQRTLVDAEGLRMTPYRDTVGKLTIGVGVNISDRGWAPLERVIGRAIDKNNPRITRDEALEMLDRDLSVAVRECEYAFPWFADQDAVRQRALVELDFNMGLSKLRTFTNTLSAWAGGRYERAADGLLASLWAKQVGPRRSQRIAAMVRTGLDA